MPKQVKCEDCGATLQVGDWPFCTKEGHPPARPASAFFAPMAVFKGPQGQVWIPPSTQSKPPKGFVREEINNRRQAEALCKDLGEKDRAKFNDAQRREREFFEKNFSRNRAEIMKMYEGVDDPKVREFMDVTMREMDRRDREAHSYSPAVYFQVLE